MKPALASALAFVVLAGCQVNVTDTRSPDAEPAGEDPGPAASTAPTVAPNDPGAEPPTLQDKLKGQKICTSIGCTNGFTVEVAPAAWPKGKYKFVITADDKTSTCEAALPLPACGQGNAVTCKGDVEVMIGETGCALPPDQQGFGSFLFKGTPAKVGITISRGGKEVGKGEFTPAYKKLQPNGPDCEPTCTHASDKLTLK